MSSESTAQTQSTTPTPTQVAISSDPLLCQWVQCGERCTSPEALYDHVCERHVGRKSTNNLNLQCAWGNCRTTTVKRDHITSHIRVHVPLKPHKCDFCGKSFKRPQDLKKHVKTHADDSVLLRSPQPDVPTQKAPVMNNYTHQATSRSYDTHYTNLSSQQGSYGYPTAVHGGGHFSQPTAIPSYGPVYYNMPQATNYATGPVDSRKRGMDDLNDFFGNAKRRHIDATQYQDLGARFGNMMNMGMPMPGFQAGYNAGLAAAGATMVDDMMGPLNFAPTHAAHGMTKQYLPFPELKTKDDLMSIDQFLENLQTTVYESTESGVSTGIPTGVQPVNTGYANATAYRHSPPYLSPHTASSHANTPGGLSSYGVPSSASSATFDDTTPALTPSSHLAASQSPASTQNHISPAPRPLTGNGLYPTLPSFSSLTDVQSQPLASYTTSTTQLSSLGPSYDDLEARRCYSGGYLQRAPRISPPSRPYDGSDTTSPSSRRSSIDLSKPFRNVGISSPPNNNVKLPGVAAITRVESASSVSSDGSADERQEAWVRNMRVIEALQRYVKDRLEKGEFESTDGDSLMSDDGREGVESTREKTGQVVYPTLRPVQAMS